MKKKRNPINLNHDNIRRWCYINFLQYIDELSEFLYYPVDYKIYSSYIQKKIYEKFFRAFNIETPNDITYPIEYWILEYSILFVLIFHHSNLHNLEKLRYWKYFMSTNERFDYINTIIKTLTIKKSTIKEIFTKIIRNAYINNQE